jgi:hypothetical protein
MTGRRALLTLIGTATGAAALPAADIEAFADRINGAHPGTYYTEALTLFRQGRREDAVFLFYLGQLRFRTHLAARSNRAPGGDDALFGALSETVGRPINLWAFGDIRALLATFDAVLAYDARVPDRFTDPAEFPDATRRTRDGLRAFRTDVANRAEEFRRERAARGLENR